MNVQSPLTGFQNQAFESNHIFRLALEVLSRPGKVMPVDVAIPAPAGLNKTTTAFILALADMETSIWICPDIKTDQLARHIGFHTGATVTADPSKAQFAITSVKSDLSVIDKLHSGTSEMPHQSATLIVMLDSFEGSRPLTLTGPGVKGSIDLSPDPLPDELLSRIKSNARLFPCGIDFIFATDTEMAGLPRTTRMEA